MQDLWEKTIPLKYLHRTIKPVRYEAYSDTDSNSDVIVGFTERGEKCFYYRTNLLIDRNIEVDEDWVQFGFYFERVSAWRLKESGKWVRIKSFTDNMDKTHKQLITMPEEISDTLPR